MKFLAPPKPHVFEKKIEPKLFEKKIQMVEVIFSAKSTFSTHIESFTPSPRKSPPKKTELQAITFYGECASNVLKSVAPPKPHFYKNNIKPEIFDKKKPRWLKSFLVPSQRFRHI